MRANSGPIRLNDDVNDERLKEYQRQQERLKAMASSSERMKPVSADVMIENLLKQSFKKPTTQPKVTGEKSSHSIFDLPMWLQCESSMVPAHYKQLWSLVQLSPEFADTQKVSQLLLTSGLHTDVLGFIWNLANRSIPGQLTKQEFYVVLALVGLAQTGCTFNNLSILSLIPSAPIPVLQVKTFERVIEKTTNVPNVSNSFDEFQQFSSAEIPKRVGNSETGLKKPSNDLFHQSAGNIGGLSATYDVKTDFGFAFSDIKESHISDVSKTVPKTSNFPCIGSSPTAELETEDDFTEFQSVTPNLTQESIKKQELSQPDDFTDFQSADVKQEGINQIDPLGTVIITQKKETPKISLPKNLTGKITSLKTNILKISPESERKLKILSQPESLSTLPESKISSNNKVSSMPSIAVISSGRGIGSRLANHSLGTRVDKPKHHKHHKMKGIPNLEDVSKPPNVEELFPKCYPKNSSGSKTFLLKETKIRSNESFDSPVKQKPEPENDFDSLTSIAGKNTRKIEIPMLGTFNETVLPTQTGPTPELFSVEEDKYSALRDLEMHETKQNVEKCGEETSDDFGDFLSADLPPKQENLESGWGDWNQNINSFAEVKESSNDTRVPETAIDFQNSNNSIDLLNFDVGFFDNSRIQASSDVQNEQVLTIKKTEDEFDDASNDKLEWITSQTKSIQLDNGDSDFGSFLSSELKPPVSDNLSRHSSLPSLDLRVSPTEESEQEVISRKCLESCLNILQEGCDIFNNIPTKSILDEVFSTEEASDYLNNLSIAYNISRRISQNCGGEITTIQEDIEKIWQRLQEYCYEYNVKLKEDEDSTSGFGNQCNLCLGVVNKEFIDRGVISYHPSCANLWVNCIESTLPCSA